MKIKFLCRGDTQNQILFTDEKTFIVQSFWNLQNQSELLLKGSPRIVKIEKVSSEVCEGMDGDLGIGKSSSSFQNMSSSTQKQSGINFESVVISSAKKKSETSSGCFSCIGRLLTERRKYSGLVRGQIPGILVEGRSALKCLEFVHYGRRCLEDDRAKILCNKTQTLDSLKFTLEKPGPKSHRKCSRPSWRIA